MSRTNVRSTNFKREKKRTSCRSVLINPTAIHKKKPINKNRCNQTIADLANKKSNNLKSLTKLVFGLLR